MSTLMSGVIYHSANVEVARARMVTAVRGRRPQPPELVQRRRREIVEAAYEVFAAKGYGATGIADIAERLDIGHGTIYRYFKNKRDILEHVVDYGVERVVAALDAATAEPACTLEEFRAQLRLIGERLFALLDAEPALGQIVLLEATSVDEELTEHVLGLFDRFGALGGAFLRHGVSQGFLRPDLDAANLGPALTALTLPALFAAVRGETTRAQRTRYTDAAVGLICDGIGSEQPPD